VNFQRAPISYNSRKADLDNAIIYHGPDRLRDTQRFERFVWFAIQFPVVASR
jgi:hypothetical protein